MIFWSNWRRAFVSSEICMKSCWAPKTRSPHWCWQRLKMSNANGYVWNEESFLFVFERTSLYECASIICVLHLLWVFTIVFLHNHIFTRMNHCHRLQSNHDCIWKFYFLFVWHLSDSRKINQRRWMRWLRRRARRFWTNSSIVCICIRTHIRHVFELLHLYRWLFWLIVLTLTSRFEARFIFMKIKWAKLGYG